ncbi:MAG: hypothetical protein ACYTGQ_06095 [Planctomycetota bacterium]|jgi:hypothetical protein
MLIDWKRLIAGRVVWCLALVMGIGGGSVGAADGCCVGEMTEGLRREMAEYRPMIDELMGDIAKENRAKAQALVKRNLTQQDLKLEQGLVDGLIRLFTGNGPYDGFEWVAVQRVSSRVHRLHLVLHFRDKVAKSEIWLRRFKGKWYFTHADLEEPVRAFEDETPYVFLLED